ncbi:tRNA-intron endonuclease catalytic domain-like protein [Laetiporus sulphureus 93-53]|uniref:tRNA-splicing endonuclease subunit Sen34 n=1 Tax=Laetiporus sulphureus 93-53 TaxID=1314785 RepID=A0A165H3W5_9APHY|nr:tRNA-intron endonuclease catalytic domain-like protein [Laetiporus sulphureus 93-53]KZT11207.1 tRNA-intron endonuclease catalytic domain-like protein [Laetiporus sulphureus 93-53]
MADPGRRIPLRVSNGKAYAWDIDDIAVLRGQHHICGVLTGTLPHLSQQNVFLGIPLVLMPEEVVVLVEKQLAVLVDDLTAHRTPSIETLKGWNEERAESARLQIAAAEEDAQDRPAKYVLSEDALRKRKEREERRAAAAKAKALAEGEDIVDPSILASTSAPQNQAVMTERPPNSAANNVTPPYTITLPASSSSLQWYDTEGCTYTSIEDARAAGVWTYPADLHERAKCGVFRDLWEKGYFMGGGIKFGGDFLVYPGDPLRYHSHFVATVIDAPLATIKPMEIVAHGRLGTATKKAHLLCGWEDEKQEVSYFSIEWAGFG